MYSKCKSWNAQVEESPRKIARNIFEPRTATGSVLFSYLTSLHDTIFILLSIFSLVETISLKIGERPLS